MATVQRASMIQYPDGQVVIHNIRKKRVSVPVFGANESYSATLVNTWYDGTAMDDSKADGSIYFKLKALPSGADPSLEQYVGSYFRLNLPNEGGLFLEKDTMQEMRDLNSTEILLLQMGYYKGVKLNGYYAKGDTPAPINYVISTTTAPDDGGSVIAVGVIKLEHDFINGTHVRYFGAKCNGFSDWTNDILTGDIDTDSWKNAIQYLKNVPYKILRWDGISRVDDTLIVDYSGLVVEGTNPETDRIIKSGNAVTSGLGVVGDVDYDGIDALFVTYGYVGDFVFRSGKFEVRDNSDYVFFMPKNYRPYFSDIYLWGGKENLRMFQTWNANFFKVRSQGVPLSGSETPTTNYGFRIEGYPRLPDGSPNLANPYQNTSINFDNCYAERVNFGYKVVNTAYFSGNSLSADSNFECVYWFVFSVGSLQGVGTEKSRGQLIRNWGSNMVVNGHQVLEIRNYSGTPVEAVSKAKIEVTSNGRGNTGLILNGSVIRGYPSAYRDGDADWIYVGSNAQLTMTSWNHTPILTPSVNAINGRTLDGIFQRDNTDEFVRIQQARPYTINDLNLLPSTYGYNQNRVILNQESVVAINTSSSDTALTEISIPLSDILKVFPDFNQTDGFIRDIFQFKIKYSGSLSITPFSRTTVYGTDVYRIGTGTVSSLSSVSINGDEVVFTLTSSANRPVVTIERLKQGYPRNANTAFRGLMRQGVGQADISIDDLVAITEADATDEASSIALVNAIKNFINTNAIPLINSIKASQNTELQNQRDADQQAT